MGRNIKKTLNKSTFFSPLKLFFNWRNWASVVIPWMFLTKILLDNNNVSSPEEDKRFWVSWMSLSCLAIVISKIISITFETYIFERLDIQCFMFFYLLYYFNCREVKVSAVVQLKVLARLCGVLQAGWNLGAVWKQSEEEQTAWRFKTCIQQTTLLQDFERRRVFNFLQIQVLQQEEILIWGFPFSNLVKVWRRLQESE